MANDLITANSTALWKVQGSGANGTLSVSPTHTGSLLVFSTSYAGTGPVAALSGGGCNASGSGLPGAWQLIAGPFTNSVSNKIELWMGQVITTGTSNISITNTSTGSPRFNCKEFYTAGGLGTVWTQDGAGGTKANASASTTVTFPTLTPSGINRLYVGFGTNGTGSTSGQTAGYTVELDPGSNPYLYNASVPNSAQTPTSVTTSSVSYLVAALIKADNPVQQPAMPPARMIRASNW